MTKGDRIGLLTITTHHGGIEVDHDDQPCNECADIRAVIDRAEGRESSLKS